MSYASGNKITRSITADDFSNLRSDGTTFVFKQGQLKDRLGEMKIPPITVRDVSNLTDTDKKTIKTAVENAYPQAKHRIKTYAQQSNGDVLITYKDGTTRTVTPKLEQNYQTKSDRFYAIAGENSATLTARDFVRSADGTELPSNTNVVWKNGTLDLSTPGDKTATLTVTDSKGVSKDITYNYTVYPKIETKTNNGETGKFYAFKAASGDRTVGGSYANNIGGFSNLYLNNDSLPSGTTFAYEYRLNNNQSAPLSKQDGSPAFSTVWHTTADSATTHRTTYTAKATYPKGRLGDVTASNPALTSSVTFDYTVVDPVAKQEYTTKVGDTTPLNDIIANPGNALKNSDSRVVIPTGTTYNWVSTPDASAPGIYKKEARVTLPQGSADKAGNSTNVPVTIKVRPNPPQISADQVTNTGGLSNKGITVTNALPNAQVTLTIGGKTLTKQADNAGNVTFSSTEVADGNGLLPTGNVTVKQSKAFTNPVTNSNETLESDVRTVAITPETEKPQVIDTVVKVKNDDNTWSAAPKEMNNGTPEYTFYSGDS